MALNMNRDEFAKYLEDATLTLADIAFSKDMNLELAQSKAKRVYAEIRNAWSGPGPDDDHDGS